MAHFAIHVRADGTPVYVLQPRRADGTFASPSRASVPSPRTSHVADYRTLRFSRATYSG